jgi:hypothetical protein
MSDTTIEETPKYRATYSTTIQVIVEIVAEDEDNAADASWEIVETYLQTLGTQTLGTQTGDLRIVSVDASVDGVGADEVIEVEEN